MIVIIGATSFIGMYTTEAFLKAGEKVLATGRNRIAGEMLQNMGASFLSMDISVESEFEKLPSSGVDGVILLAGHLPANEKVNLDQDENFADYIKINTLGTIHVLEYCRRHHIRRVMGACSYSDVSGAWGGPPVTEETPRSFSFTGDHAAYVISKNAANDSMEYYNQQHHMQCAWFRFPQVYGVGPHDIFYVNGEKRKSGVLTFIEKAMKGERIELWGDPHRKRDIVYVKDVAEAYVKAMKSERTYGLYNITGHMQVDVEMQAKAAVRVFGQGKSSEIVCLESESDKYAPSYLYSIEKARHDFDYEPHYTDFFAIMEDYKKELDSHRWDQWIQSRMMQEN